MMTRSQRMREEKEVDEEAAEVSEDAAAEVGKDAAAAVAGIVAAPDAAYEDLALADLPADVRDAATWGTRRSSGTLTAYRTRTTGIGRRKY